jgi:hypothetical protein
MLDRHRDVIKAEGESRQEGSLVSLNEVRHIRCSGA